MARACLVCSDERRVRIERAVIGGSVRGVASRFGVHPSALRRHVQTHFPDRLRKGAAAGEILTADRLLSEIQTFGREAARLQRRAERGGDVKTAIQALRERTRNVELLARALAAQPQPPAGPLKFVVDLSREGDDVEVFDTAPPKLLAAPETNGDEEEQGGGGRWEVI